MSNTERVLVPLPDGRWLALASDAFAEALRAGAEMLAAPGASDAAQAGDAEPLLDAEQLADRLALPVTWVEQAAREGRIPSVRAGRWRRFKRSAVERVLAANGAHK
jgi:excisionase family DNA binding protein